jgi:hypothetical protein
LLPIPAHERSRRVERIRIFGDALRVAECGNAYDYQVLYGACDMIYLCILEDRHIDNVYAAFHDLEKAKLWCWENALESYKGSYEFSIPEWNWQQHYEDRLESGEECPSYTIEKVELK